MKRRADRLKAKARARRRMYPIRAYVGPNGTGKSAVLVYDTIPSLEMGRPVLSTVRLLDYRNPRPCDDALCSYPSHPDHQAAHPLYVPFTDFCQLLDWRGGDVLMDEVTGVASSRESSKMPVQVSNMLVQLRRRDVQLSWSAPAWGRADIIMREVTQLVTLMSASMPARSPDLGDGMPRLWHQRRLFTARSYDPVNMNEFEAHRADKIPHDIVAYYWGPGSTMFRAYDTLDSITSLGWAHESGMCLNCAGRRSVPKCSCDDEGKPGTSGSVGRQAQRGPALPVVPVGSGVRAGGPARDLGEDAVWQGYRPVAGR